MPPGLEGAVDFWKLIFARYSFAEVVFFDPMDPGKIYSVLRVPESGQGRALVEKERARIAADYELIDDETRVRSQRGAKEHFGEGLRISGKYIAQMQKIFRDEGLPPELAYLPLVESSFNIRARSGVGAVGMWQFMAETGKKFMRIDGAVDERRDPMASTRAAARLLKQNYRILGSWPLAITAYNHGTEGVSRGINAVGSRDLIELIRRYQVPSFGFASKNFYAEFLAVVDIAAKSDNHFPFLRPHPPVALREVEVKRAAPLHAVLKPASISRHEFFEWNPALDPNSKVIPLGYRVKLPPEKVESFRSAHEKAVDAPLVNKGAAKKSQNAKATMASRKISAKPHGKPVIAKTTGKAKVKTAQAAKRQSANGAEPEVK